MQPIADTEARTVMLTDGWALALSPPDAWAAPDDAALGEWLPIHAPVPAAAALAALGRWSDERPAPLHDRDVWYRTRLAGPGRWRLRLGGLAAIAEVWLDGARILDSDNMFRTHEVAVDLRPESELFIAFRSLDAALARRSGKRARWRATMIDDQRLRLIRTTLLGHMPGWCPPIDIVGPWRPIELVEDRRGRIADAELRAVLEGSTGRLDVTLACDGPAPAKATLHLGDHAFAMAPNGGRLVGQAVLPGVRTWWPHSHGEPALYPVSVTIGGRRIDLGRTGFRTVALDRGSDGRTFRVLVNGVPVFCRGAVWGPADIVGLPQDRAGCERSLRLAREAGVNMLRVGGTMVYESRAFHDLCDELGILVWQDAMLANFDYPARDDGFAESIRVEVEQLLGRLQASPSLAVLCGGSEVAQQAAMLGLPPASWSNRIVDEILPDAAARLRPDIAYVPSSPFGGDLPFVADAGCTHYYGVGAYRRPLEDARRAGVRFASECLAFANVPDGATLRAALPVAAVHHPVWKAGVPRDLGAAWDFEDVRDHYMALLYGVDPARLRTEDPLRYLDLSRAAVADVIEATIGEWHRPGSPTGGALVWLWQDLRPGAGWGMIDALGQPKSVWHALKRACRPIQLLPCDEGVNGLRLHALNETAETVAVTVSLACLRDGRVPVAAGEKPVEIPPYGAVSLSATELLGAFFDITYAYRFGPAAHDVSHARLTGADGALLAEAFHWLPGRRAESHRLGLTAALDRDDAGWVLRLAAERVAAAVHVDDDHYRAADDGFDLAPGAPRSVRLLPRRDDVAAPPDGEVRAINGRERIRFAPPGA